MQILALVEALVADAVAENLKRLFEPDAAADVIVLRVATINGSRVKHAVRVRVGPDATRSAHWPWIVVTSPAPSAGSMAVAVVWPCIM